MATDLERQLLEITEVFAKGDVDATFERMAALELACRNDVERSQVMARYVTFFHLLDMPDEELSALAQALILDPNNPRANYLNAVHLMSDERWDDSIQSLNIAARYYPPEDNIHLAEVYGNLAYCWEQLNDPERAAMYREISMELDPEGDLQVPEDEEDHWPAGLEADAAASFEIPPDELCGLDGYDEDDEDQQPVSTSIRLDEMLREMGGKRENHKGLKPRLEAPSEDTRTPARNAGRSGRGPQRSGETRGAGPNAARRSLKGSSMNAGKATVDTKSGTKSDTKSDTNSDTNSDSRSGTKASVTAAAKTSSHHAKKPGGAPRPRPQASPPPPVRSPKKPNTARQTPPGAASVPSSSSPGRKGGKKGG